jgi:photosystem II stability/assembly factor-like uncharacterized protein
MSNRLLLAVLLLAIVALTSLSLTVHSSASAPLLATNQRIRQPTITPQNSGTTQGLIAVSPVNSRVVWVSGRGGTFAVTTNGGQTWRAGVVPGAQMLQFRDVEGVSSTEAYLLSIGNGTDSRIYKTIDGGATWTLQFQNQDPNAFYDCFAFWTPDRGLAHSDPVNDRFPDLLTTDGLSWQDIGDNLPTALAGEFSFASSGTCVAAQGRNNAWIVTGGASPSRVFVSRDAGETWTAHASPLRGSPSAGIFSVAFRDAFHGIIGGGDLDPTAPPFDQTATSSDGGRTWTITDEQPDIGTIFGLAYAGERGRGGGHGGDDNDHSNANQTVVVTGPGGAAWTPNEGDTWFTLTGVNNFWAVAFGSPKTGWLVGTEGRILKIDF